MDKNRAIDKFAAGFVYVVTTCIMLAVVAATTKFILWIFGM